MRRQAQSSSSPGRRPFAPKERRCARDGSLRAGVLWLRGLIGRPFSLRWAKGVPHLVWVERRRQRGAADPASSAQVSAELEIALMAHPDAASTMPHLVRVHDQLVLKGWPGLAVLPPELIRKALAQGRAVAALDAPALAALLDHLRQLNAHLPEAALESRDQGDTVPMRDAADHVEVSELGEADFEQLAREWNLSHDTPPASESQGPPPLH